MKVAIYTRYSSESQNAKSIEDQIRVCKGYIQHNDMSVDNEHIYTDEAISGSVINRPGLQALERAAENKEFQAVIVDDLSRLSRSNHQMLTLVLKFNYLQIKIVSVSDGIITDDDDSKVGIHIRGLVNELYLDDLKKKTIRGLEGQKLRGFSVGEKVYGYDSHPVGELKLNKKGQAKYDGMVHKINPEEATIIKRIYNEFINGKSLNRIVVSLNKDKIPTKRGYPAGWNRSTVSRILKNEKYTGIWAWKKWKNVRNPLTGRIKKVPRPKEEQLSAFREDLIIIDKEAWEKAQKRWKDIDGTWPIKKTRENGTLKQKSYIHTTPTHLFAGLMKCQCCGSTILLVSGKGSGYYGCYNAIRKTCDNTLKVPRKRIEEIIISDLGKNVLTAENLNYIYKNIEKLVNSGMNEVPEQIKNKKAQRDKISAEIHNYMNYIKIGNFSNAVSAALKEAEAKNENLKQDIESLEFQRQYRFKAPPREWVDHRLKKLRETLNKRTTVAALVLKKILGTIQLEPICEEKDDFYGIINSSPQGGGSYRKGLDKSSPYILPDKSGNYNGGFKPYYVAHMKAQTLVLLDKSDKGANWERWWAR